MAWVVLFIASPITFALLLWSGRHAQPPPNDPRLNRAVRTVLVVLAIAFAGRLVLGYHRRSSPFRGGASRCPLPGCLARILRGARRLAGSPAHPLRGESATPVPRRVRCWRTARGCVHPGQLGAGSLAISLPSSASSPSPASRLSAVPARSDHRLAANAGGPHLSTLGGRGVGVAGAGRRRPHRFRPKTSRAGIQVKSTGPAFHRFGGGAES